MLSRHWHPAALMRFLDFLLRVRNQAVTHFPAPRVFLLRTTDACRALLSPGVTCRASLAAYAGAKGFGSCDVMIVSSAFFVFFAMALLQRNPP
jgi:hypothetical protein